MATKYFLAKYNKGLQQVKDENELLKKEIEDLKNKNKKNERLFIIVKRLADKGNILLNNILGSIYAHDSDFENALKYLTFASDKDYVNSHFNLGVLYHYLNDIEKSMKYFKLALSKRYKISEKWMEIINKYIPNEEIIELKRKRKSKSVPILTDDTKRQKLDNMISNTLVTDTISDISDEEEEYVKPKTNVIALYNTKDDDVIVID